MKSWELRSQYCICGPMWLMVDMAMTITWLLANNNLCSCMFLPPTNTPVFHSGSYLHLTKSNLNEVAISQLLFFCRKNYREPKMLRPMPRISWWRVIGIELLDIKHLPIDVWQQFSNLIELWSCTTESPHCHPLFLLHQDPWIISFWSHKGMNKSFIAPFAPTEIPSSAEYLWMKESFTQGHIQWSHAKWNWWVRFSTLCLRNVPCNLFKCIFFLHCLPPHMSHSGGEANGEIHSQFIPHFTCSFKIYWQNLITGPYQNDINGQ